MKFICKDNCVVNVAINIHSWWKWEYLKDGLSHSEKSETVADRDGGGRWYKDGTLRKEHIIWYPVKEQ
jgi:hypothetical protein